MFADFFGDGCRVFVQNGTNTFERGILEKFLFNICSVGKSQVFLIVDSVFVHNDPFQQTDNQ